MTSPDLNYWLTQLTTAGWSVTFTYAPENHRFDVVAQRGDQVVTAWGMQAPLAAKNLYNQVNAEA